MREVVKLFADGSQAEPPREGRLHNIGLARDRGATQPPEPSSVSKDGKFGPGIEGRRSAGARRDEVLEEHQFTVDPQRDPSLGEMGVIDEALASPTGERAMRF